MRMGVRVRMFMVVAMMVAGAMRVLVLMFVDMIMLVSWWFRTNAHRVFSGQSASAIFTHQSISSEATSISRPARISPLRAWQSGHSANISSA